MNTMTRALRPLFRPIYHKVISIYINILGWINRWKFPQRQGDSARLAFLLGTYEPDTTEAVIHGLSEGAVFVDVGAHAGYYSRLAAKILGKRGKVIAFEPEPDNFACLINNTSQFSNVFPIPVALTDELGLKKLYISPFSGCHSLVNSSSENKYIWVPTISFDNFYLQSGLSVIELMKIDVEGAELFVLDGMRCVLEKKKIKTLIIEFSPYNLLSSGSNPIKLGKLLLDYFKNIKVLGNGQINTYVISDLHDFNALISEICQKDQRESVNLICC